MDETLFGTDSSNAPAVEQAPSAAEPPRLRLADREQVLLRPCAIQELLEPDHAARWIWAVVCRWDLRKFLAKIAARGSRPGRAATDPRILISLWLYAYTQGISSARELERYCDEHNAYIWIRGNVSVNYHLLSDFRVMHEQAIDDLLTQMIAVLISKDIVTVERIANDGTRVRAGAGRNSFKTAEGLKKCQQEAREHVEALKQQAQDPTMSLKRQKAIERGANEKLQHVDQAIAQLQKVQEAKDEQKEKPSKQRPAKASTTDPQARIMHFPDGGIRPGYNVQFGVDTACGAVVGVAVTNSGSDVHESQPMREQIERRTGRKVLEQLMDGGYVGLEYIEKAAAAGTTIYAPVPKPRRADVDRYQPRKGDGPGIIAWRQRMPQPAAKEIYKERGARIEPVNGECKSSRGLVQFLVEGLDKVRCIALWSALAYNFVHFAKHLVA